MPGDFFFLNYGVQDGNVMQGLFRVEKSTLELQVYNGSQWIPVAGGGGGDTSAKAMSTVQRMAFVPASGALIWDTDLERLFVGTSHNAGGVEVGGSNARNLTTAERMEITPASGELIFDTDEGVLYIGDGFTVGGNAVGGGGGGDVVVHATPIDIMTGSGASKVLDVSNFRAALTAGQAVDVTSQPDGVTGDYRSTFSVTGSLGFASFPKYASGLSYLMIADLTATTSGTVTPRGTWLDGTATVKSLEAGTSTRVAMLFNAANKAKFTFSSTGSVSVTNCREYEVTACSAEAIAYIAQLTNPDAFASYYLIKPDMVQPWTAIIDMGSSPAVTIASGLSYKLNAAAGVHQLTVDTCPVGYDGRDAIIRITLGGSGVVQVVAPLQLGGALVPYAINNCVVRFRDGEAVLLVEDTLAGYVVTVTSGTDNGSLAYGLAATGIPYIAFSTGTDGQVVDMGNAVTANEEVTVVGNGYTNTTITGNITCTNKTTMANLGLQDVTVLGGTMTLGDAFIPSGSTVAVSGGGLAVEKVSGNGGVIDLGYNSATQTGGTSILASSPVYIKGITAINGSATDIYQRGGFISASHNLFMESCTISKCSALVGTALYLYDYWKNKTQIISSCTIVGNGTIQVATEISSPVFKDCLISGGGIDIYTGGYIGNTQLAGGNVIGTVQLGNGTTVSFAGSNKVDSVRDRSFASTGLAVLSSGAILDLTGNSNTTPIAPGGGIVFEDANQIKYGTTENPTTAYIDGCTAATIASGGVVQLSTVSGGTVTVPRNILIASDNTFVASNLVLTGGSGTFNNKGTLTLTSAVISGGVSLGASGNGGALYNGDNSHPVPASAYLTSCTVTDTEKAIINYRSSYIMLSECVVSGNTIYDIRTVGAEGSVICSGGTYGSIQHSAGTLAFAGVNSVTRVSGGNGAAVVISSGASINLTSSIDPGGTGAIHVVGGTCTVNGNVIESGTYTSIDSNGQPT